MNYSEIKYCDIANGEGVRTSLFVSGCRHACPGCFNPEQQDFTAGEPFDQAVQDKVLESLAPVYVEGLTVLGGEPMEPENQRALVGFLERVRREYPSKTIWAYTGDLLEDLRNPESPRHTDVTDRVLGCIDVLVDGPFVETLYDITLRFRGSSNQRLIDLPATLAAGSIVLWSDDPQFTTHTMVDDGPAVAAGAAVAVSGGAAAVVAAPTVAEPDSAVDAATDPAAGAAAPAATGVDAATGTDAPAN